MKENFNKRKTIDTIKKKEKTKKRDKNKKEVIGGDKVVSLFYYFTICSLHTKNEVFH